MIGSYSISNTGEKRLQEAKHNFKNIKSQNSKLKKFDGCEDVVLETLEEYTKIAQKMHAKYHSRMVQDYHELIAYLVYYLIWADINLHTKKLTYTKYKFRYLTYKFAIRRWSHTNKKNISIVNQKYINSIYKKEEEPIDCTELIDNAQLTQKERDVIRMYFYENYTLEEIGDISNVSKQAIGIRLKNALKKMKKVAYEYEGGQGR